MTATGSELFEYDTPNLMRIVNSINAGIWEFDLITKEVKWSAGFYNILGYQPGDIECSYANFIENLVYYQDKDYFLKTLNKRPKKPSETTYIRLLTKNGYEWFQSVIQKQIDAKLSGTFININGFKSSELQLSRSNIITAEANTLVKFGGWEIDIQTNNLLLSDLALDILAISNQFKSVDDWIVFFGDENYDALSTAINYCISIGRPCELDLSFKKSNKIVWIKIKAVAQINNDGRCMVIKGVLQDITLQKRLETELKSSLTLAHSKNNRLESFAYIVSHNLRTYTDNLQSMLKLYQDPEEGEHQEEILSKVNIISNSLNTTIEHLTAIVKIDKEIDKQKVLIEIAPYFESVVQALTINLKSANALVKYDFSNCRYIHYLPAYLESIFHNLLTNSIKYRDPSRQVIITCVSKIEDNHACLIFEDNGLGMDLKSYGSKVFNLYQTFHHNKDAQGVGLFITRTQIEALGGSITVESTLNVGTKFIIKLHGFDSHDDNYTINHSDTLVEGF